MKSRHLRGASPGLLRLATGAPAPIYAAAALVWGCAVYDSELTAGGELSGSGAVGAESAVGGVAHGGSPTNMTAGKSSSAGTFTSSSGTPSGGTSSPPVEAGASGEEGGMAGDGPSGTGGGGAAAGSGGAAGKGGAGGSGGKASTGECALHPLTAKATWVASASISSPGNGTESDGLYNPPFHAIDSDNSERWSTGKTQKGGEWFKVDFGAMVTLSQITLQIFGKDVDDFPRAWGVSVTDTDPDLTSPVILSGTGVPGPTSIQLQAPVTGQFLFIRQTAINETGTEWWTIAELLVGCTD